MAGLTGIRIEALGRGVFSARYLLIERLVPAPLRLIGYWSLRYVALILDAAFAWLARLSGRKYDPADYALGYCVTARKP